MSEKADVPTEDSLFRCPKIYHFKQLVRILCFSYHLNLLKLARLKLFFIKTPNAMSLFDGFFLFFSESETS